MLTWQQSIGIEETHLSQFSIDDEAPVLINKNLVTPLSLLVKKAKADDVAISIVSAFRSFDRQLAIWNDKWLGYKPVYSRQGRPLNILKMSQIEKYKAICLWSALPGLSRHHWGSDLDIFACHAIEQGHQVALVPEEFSINGPCHQLNLWLESNLTELGFFRPYSHYQQGVSVEPWHISHIDTASDVLQNFDQSACRQYLETSGIQSAGFIQQQFNHYYQQYFGNINQPPRGETT